MYRVLIILIVIYGISMIAYPWVSSGFEWSEVQKVWSHWQTLNSGVIALIAALIGLYAANYKERKEQNNRLVVGQIKLALKLGQLRGVLLDWCDDYKLLLKEYQQQGNLNRVSVVDVKIIDSELIDRVLYCIENSSEKTSDFYTDFLNGLNVSESRHLAMTNKSELKGLSDTYIESNITSLISLSIHCDRILYAGRRRLPVFLGELTVDEIINNINSLNLYNVECGYKFAQLERHNKKLPIEHDWLNNYR